MTTDLTTGELPRDTQTGLILPLSKSLGSRELAQHRALVAVELEVLAKKFDRFGWERDRGSMASDRMLTDWMDALQDFPLDEVRAACKSAVLRNPDRMPNEGHVRAEIMKSRAVRVKPALPALNRESEPRVSKERAAEILAEAGFAPRRFGQEAAE